MSILKTQTLYFQFKQPMQQVQFPNRQRSLSNNSSITTPKLIKKASELKKDALMFSRILNQPKNLNLPFNSEQEQPNSMKAYKEQRKNGKNHQRKLSTASDQDHHFKQKGMSPCKDLFSLFLNHKLSAEYIRLMQQEKLKYLVIVSVLLPTDLMKQFSKIMDFQHDYKISLPQNVFCTDFFKLNVSPQSERYNYTFWTYEVNPENQQEQDVRQSYMSNRLSPISSRSVQELKYKRLSDNEQYKANTKNLLIEIPQIVITTKGFIKANWELFFTSENSEYVNPTQRSPKPISLQPQLDVEKSLLFFEDTGLFQPSTNSIPTPRQLKTSNRKIKNPEANNHSFIQIQQDEEYFDDLRDRKPMIKKEVQQLDSVRSNDLLTDNHHHNHDEIFQLVQKLEKESHFKNITHLHPFWIEASTLKSIDPSEMIHNPKRKNPASLKNIEQQKTDKFRLFLHEEIKLSLKRNLNFSKFCAHWLFLHFLSTFYSWNVREEKKQFDEENFHFDSQKKTSYGDILVKSLKSFQKQIQLRFIQRVQSEYRGMMDEAELRNILRNIRTEELVFMKNNFNSIVYPITVNNPSISTKNIDTFLSSHHEIYVGKDFVSEIQQEIINSMDQSQRGIYEENDKQASSVNLKVLESYYQKIIEEGFRRERLKKKESMESSSSLNSDQRPMSLNETSKKKMSTESVSIQLQKDLNDFIDSYSIKGIKVSSQLKTFNIFMQKCKQSYLKNVYQLTQQKKNYEKQQEQKQNKNRMIKLLQTEIQRLENQKKEIKDKNDIIKKQIRTIDQKNEILDRNNFQSKREKSKMSNRRMQDSSASGQTDKNPKKQSLSFQIQNNKNSSIYQDGEGNRANYSRFDKTRNAKKETQDMTKMKSKREIIEEQEEEKKQKNRCLTCCQIM